MLVHVVAIPLDHRPIELLPPCPGNRKSVSPKSLLSAAIAEGSKEETLQIPIRRQFLDVSGMLLQPDRHRQIAPRQRPRRRPAPTVISRLNLRRPPASGGNPNPSTTIRHRRAIRESSTCSTPSLPAAAATGSRSRRCGASRTTAKISRAACASPSPAAAPHPSGSPGIRPPESRTARRIASAIPDPPSPRTHACATGPSPVTFVTKNSAAAIRTSGRKIECAITPARRTSEEIRSTNGTIDDVRSAGDKSATAAACAAAVLPCDPRVT